MFTLDEGDGGGGGLEQLLQSVFLWVNQHTWLFVMYSLEYEATKAFKTNVA